MISVIIPLYNKEPIIGRTIKSVLSQDHNDFEVIVVNDGSTDRSVKIVRSIDDCRIRLIDQENGGPSKARNTGIKNAKGEWLYFIDADDEMEPGALNHYAELVSRYPDTDIFMGEVFYNDGIKKKISCCYQDGYIDNIYKSLFFHKINPCSGTLLYRKSLCIKHPYKENLRRFEDLECLTNKFREAKLFATHFPTSIVNVEFAEASRGRKDINEDFVGYLNFKNKCFWEKMCLYQLYLGERTIYPGQIDKLYPTLRYRYDLLLLYKILKYFHAHF